MTNLEDMSQRHAPPELYRHIIARLHVTPTQQQTIALGLTVFHELLLSLKAEQTRLQQQLQQALQRVQGGAAGAQAAAGAGSLQDQQQQLQALLARQDDLAWLQPASVQAHVLQPAAAASAAAAAAAASAAAAAAAAPPVDAAAAAAPLVNAAAADDSSVAAMELLSLLDQGQADLDQQHQLLQRVETNNWQLSWMICLLNFFISGVLDLPQLCKCAVYSYPWPWWPGPFAEEVLHMYNEQQQQQQKQASHGNA